MNWFHICFSFKLEALQILKYNPGRICLVREECGITEGRGVSGGAQGGGGGKGIFISPLCPIGIEVFTSLQTIVASMGPVRGSGRLQASPSWEFLFAAGILDIACGEGRRNALCRW